MHSAEHWIEMLEMTAHQEGGYYRQVLKSTTSMPETTNSARPRSLYTSIYFLLTDVNPSRFHRLTADEVWYYHEGAPLTVHLIHPDGRYEQIQLGKDIAAGQHLQAVVPKNVIFGSSVETDYALVSCMVAPGFEYEDFELFKRSELLDVYPAHAEIITRLTAE